ncbi:hypothetical protein I6A84_36450 [Frankia sp. CNm7]|uniref:hypothetical protein n=1 Tax=Frankia nepalensis TaxID=1836974 RepID=UPI0019325990|nr:hypothetical protein [Frankia nepalensis]MBL7511131.1 hypothetical protein [Frankia nepalensis]MBL7523403.1 hypothetical protein [Frankia nepalensis]
MRYLRISRAVAVAGLAGMLATTAAGCGGSDESLVFQPPVGVSSPQASSAPAGRDASASDFAGSWAGRGCAEDVSITFEEGGLLPGEEEWDGTIYWDGSPGFYAVLDGRRIRFQVIRNERVFGYRFVASDAFTLDPLDGDVPCEFVRR